MPKSSPQSILEGRHVIVSCEGTGEEVVVRKLLESNALVFPPENVVDVTRKRKAGQIQEDYLGFAYDWPVCIVRVLDSLRERFQLGPLYTGRFPVLSVYTRPEIEMLAIIREGRFADYAKVKSRVKPSQYCKQDLGLAGIKSKEFLEGYWTAESLIDAAREYRSLSRLEKGEFCLADILK